MDNNLYHESAIKLIANIPQHPLFDMAIYNDLLIKGGEVFYTYFQSGESGEPYIDKNRKVISEPISLKSLDDLFYTRAEQSIEDWKKEATNLFIGTYLGFSEPFDRFESTFIDFLSKFKENSKSHKLSSLLCPETPPKIDEFDQELFAKFTEGKADILRNITNTNSNSKTLIERMFGESPTLIEREKNMKHLKLLQMEYPTMKSIPIGELKRNYLEVLYSALSEDLLINNFGEYTQFIEKNKLALQVQRFSGVKEYEKEGVGFIRNKDGNYFTLRVPTFAIKSPENGLYFLFKSFRLGIRASCPDHVYAFDGASHPFINNGSFCKRLVCFGGNEFPIGNSLVETAALRLKKAQQIIMHGYKSKNISPFRRLNVFPHVIRCEFKLGFASKLTPKFILKMRGIPILNE